MHIPKISAATIENFQSTMPVRNSLTRKLMTGNDYPVDSIVFREALSNSPTQMIGVLPKEVLGAFPKAPHKIFEVLDSFAELARKTSRPQEVLTETFSLKRKPYLFGLKNSNKMTLSFNSGKNADVEYVGSGSFGHVYKLTIDKKPFALKIFHGKARIRIGHFTTNGEYGEILTGTNLGGRKYKDISQFHIGNPKSHWMLTEYISPQETPENREGPSLKDIPYKWLDIHNKNKNKHGIIFDLGGFIPLDRRDDA